jgi:hypothetical protein
MGRSDLGEQSSMFETKSEELFHKWMTGLGWSLRKIPTSTKPGERTPDFELTKDSFLSLLRLKNSRKPNPRLLTASE